MRCALVVITLVGPLVGPLVGLLAAPALADSTAIDLAGSEIRRTSGGGGDTRYDVWRLSADGSLTGNYQIEYRTKSQGGYAVDGPVAGRWSLDNGTLCVEGSGLARSCYRIERTASSDPSRSFRAVGDGQLYIYPRTGS